MQSNKQIFNIHELPTDEYAHSLGLAQPPRIRFLQRAIKSQRVSNEKGKNWEEKEEEGERGFEIGGGSESESVNTDREDGSGDEDNRILTVKW